MPLRFAVALGLLAACGAGDRQATGPSDLVIEKAPTNSGDRQVGVAGEPLEQDFRALVTLDGKPAEGVTVYWTTMQGSMNPVTDLTDADGISASRWTTKVLYTEQEAYASLQARWPQYRAGRRQRASHLGSADRLSQVPQLQVHHPGRLPLPLCGARRTRRRGHVGHGDGTAAACD